MPRYAFRIEYDGAPFRGWQRQTDLPSVQGAVEVALARLDPACPDVQGAGRTDTGVHALAQVAHADLSRVWDPYRLTEALNYHLKPAPVAITAAAQVPEDFHARFSAIRRAYRFRIVIRRAPLALEAGKAWRIGHALDASAMQEAAQALIGQHDFTTFRSSICQAKSPVKTMDKVSVTAIPRHDGGTDIVFELEARSFLHNQVRSIVGSLERVGSGAWSVSRISEVLSAADRTKCGPVAPPHGLYLTSVSYPDPIFGK